MDKASKEELEGINEMLSKNPVSITLHFKDGSMNMNYDNFIELLNKEH